MNMLFLDIDGVLNGHQWCHIGELPRIDRLAGQVLSAIAKNHDCSVVISSTWARHIEDGDCTPSGFSWMFRTHGIECRVIDGINGRVTDPAVRTANILAYIKRTNPAKWLAIDDLPLSLPHFIRPDPGCGLRPVDVKNAERIFQRQ